MKLKETLEAICDLEQYDGHAPLRASTKKAALLALAAYDPQQQEYIEALEAECKVYSDASELYGIDAMTMLALARSQIKTCADNIRMSEKMEEYRALFSELPSGLTKEDVTAAICAYDGNGEMPYCDLVWAALVAVRKYLKARGEL